MSDTESDYDENENYNEEEDYPQNNQNQQNNQKVQEFIGVIGNKPGWINCMYCDRSHPPSMHLPGIEYCIHCWAWLNINQLDLEKGTYNGLNSISDVKNILKETFKLHDPTKCTNADCAYNMIIKFEKDKKLHYDFCVELGFKVEVKQNPINQSNSTNSTNPSNNQGFKLGNKYNSRINYKLSHITI
jgi:hypothetical protein